MQYEIIAVLERTPFSPKREAKIRDGRGSRPMSSAFLVGADKHWTIAPSLAVAKEVRNAFLAWCSSYGPAGVQRVILRKYQPAPEDPAVQP